MSYHIFVQKFIKKPNNFAILLKKQKKKRKNKNTKTKLQLQVVRFYLFVIGNYYSDNQSHIVCLVEFSKRFFTKLKFKAKIQFFFLSSLKS